MPTTTKATDARLLASELRMVLGRLVRRLRSERTFPLAHAAVLSRLDREGPQSTADLALAEHVRPQSMGQTLAEMESQGLVSRRPDTTDGRRILIELTPGGERTLAEDRSQREGWLAGAIEDLTPGERATVLRAIGLLGRLVESGAGASDPA